MQRSLRIKVIVVLALVAVALVRSIDFAPDKADDPRSVDPAAASRLTAIFELYNANKLPETRAALDALDMPGLSPYARSLAEQIYIAIDIHEAKYSSAREHIDRAIATGGLDAAEVDTLQFRRVEILVAEERWSEVIPAWKEWAKNASRPLERRHCLTLAVAYHRLDDPDAATQALALCRT